jgi:hypothetical protein
VQEIPTTVTDPDIKRCVQETAAGHLAACDRPDGCQMLTDDKRSHLLRHHQDVYAIGHQPGEVVRIAEGQAEVVFRGSVIGRIPADPIRGPALGRSAC